MSELLKQVEATVLCGRRDPKVHPLFHSYTRTVTEEPNRDVRIVRVGVHIGHIHRVPHSTVYSYDWEILSRHMREQTAYAIKREIYSDLHDPIAVITDALYCSGQVTMGSPLTEALDTIHRIIR